MKASKMPDKGSPNRAPDKVTQLTSQAHVDKLDLTLQLPKSTLTPRNLKAEIKKVNIGRKKLRRA